MQQGVQFLPVDGWSWFIQFGLIGDTLLAQGASALLWDHGQEQANDLREQAQAMLGDGLAQDMPGLVIPITALSG